MLDQPLKLRPLAVSRIWGGRRLESELGKALPAGEKIGESWELFDFPPGTFATANTQANTEDGWLSSVVDTGPHAGQTLHDLIKDDATRLPLLGDVDPVGDDQFPLLIKFLDAADDLSVQVHPDEEYIKAHPDAYLKNEAWHILATEPGSRILKGVREGVDRTAFQNSLDAGDVEQQLQSIPVTVGQTYYLPSGTVHALGAGILAAEVQTPSDTTFRVFDFNRKDPATGQTRQLHVDQALACIRFEKTSTQPDGLPVKAPQFAIAKGTGRREETANRPEIWIFTRGSGKVNDLDVRAGDTLLIPAACKNVTFTGVADYLAVAIQ